MAIIRFDKDPWTALNELPVAINHNDPTIIELHIQMDAQIERQRAKRAAQHLFGTFYAGWVNFLEGHFKEPYDQVENKMRDNKQFYNQVLLVACKERIPNNWAVKDVVKVFDYILSL